MLYLPRVEQQEYGHNSNGNSLSHDVADTKMLFKIIVQDVFDELKDELEHAYKDKVWSSIGDDLKSRMKENLQC